MAGETQPPQRPPPTSVRVAEATMTNASATRFGMMMVMDDLLTVGPERSSKVVGRAQGMYASADLTTFALWTGANLVFIDGKYNGSTLSVLGREAPFSDVREMVVVGGTELFRFARGYAQAKTNK